MIPATCRWCRSSYNRRTSLQAYCSTACNAAAHKLALKRAVVLYRALYWWRYERKSATAALRFICREIRAWIEEDQKAQRLPPPRQDFDGRDYGVVRRQASRVWRGEANAN